MSKNEPEIAVRTLAARYRAKTRLHAHRHSWGQLVFAASGTMRVLSADASWLIPPTRAIWLPDDFEHEIEMQSDVTMRTLYLGTPWAAQMPREPRAIAASNLLRELILHILNIGILFADNESHQRMSGFFVELFYSAETADLILPLPRDPRAKRLAENWQCNPADHRGLSELAQESGASLRTLQRLFVRETGLSIESWRQKARLVHAIAGLASGQSVSNTAYESGYRSVAAFGAAFRRQYGAPPSHFASGNTVGQSKFITA